MLNRPISQLLLAACLALTNQAGAPAADWGYDENDKQRAPEPLRAQPAAIAKPQPLKAAPQTVPARAHATTPGATNTSAAPAATSSLFGRGPAPKSGAASSTPASAPASRKTGAHVEDSPEMIELSWAQFYELAGKKKLDDDMRGQLNSLVKRKLNGTVETKRDARSILLFWPKLQDYLVEHPEQRNNYASLAKALLRWKARNQTDEAAGDKDPLVTDECALIMQVLGALRLSAAGTVPFSEDAIDAYADMACFIFEKRNPGKSVDAIDNRAMFASVVSEKFKNAPTRKDQEAMAGFDLSWARFKIAWDGADESKRAVLLSNLIEKGAGAAYAQSRDTTLEFVLKNFPGPMATVPLSAPAALHK